MRFNFVNIQAYEIKLTRKFKYMENLAGAHVTQVDVDACYEWRPSKLQVVFMVTIQSWGHYFKKVTSYKLLVTFRKSNLLQLHITLSNK